MSNIGREEQGFLELNLYLLLRMSHCTTEDPRQLLIVGENTTRRDFSDMFSRLSINSQNWRRPGRIEADTTRGVDTGQGRFAVTVTLKLPR